jgi:IS605 OrfB family transposase
MIEAEAILVVDLAVKLNKPIVIEKLNTTKSKVSHAYGNKKANKKMSMFAYRKLISAIKKRANKMGVAVFMYT